MQVVPHCTVDASKAGVGSGSGAGALIGCAGGGSSSHESPIKRKALGLLHHVACHLCRSRTEVPCWMCLHVAGCAYTSCNAACCLDWHYLDAVADYVLRVCM